MIKLFPDQKELVDNVRNRLLSGSKSVLMQAATGSGKTFCSAYMVNSAYNRGKKVLFTVPRRDLLRQTSITFNRFNIPHSFIAAGKRYDKDARVHIASKDTIKSRLDVVGKYDLAIFDECHYGNMSLDRIVQHFKPHSTLIGMSATPWDMKGQGMAHQYEDLVCGKSTRWLIDNKRLSEYRAFAPTHVDLSNIGIVGGDYNKKQLAEKMEADILLMGDVVKHYKYNAMGKLGVTFCVRRKHSEMMAQQFRDNGVPAVHMDGNTPEEVRIKIAKAYARREIKQICNVELLTFGYDLASTSSMNACIQAMSDCQPTRSLSKQLQKDGRFLRYDGTEHILNDHVNNIATHGLPCQEREWTLEPRIKKRRSSNERLLPVKECYECHLCHKPAPSCPYCGYIYPIEEKTVEQIDVELKEIEIKTEKKRKRMEVGMARTMDDLMKIADERGYKRGWCFQQAKIKGIIK